METRGNAYREEPLVSEHANEADWNRREYRLLYRVRPDSTGPSQRRQRPQ
ncbi:hypothetical protein NJ7G_2138 [Natrinema sp. J7-2]|nr:hypothetical protein NJ7G_2138 [Natrinema sp. J7-2]